MSHPRNPDRRARRGAIGGDGFAAGGSDVDVAMEASMPKNKHLAGGSAASVNKNRDGGPCRLLHPRGNAF